MTFVFALMIGANSLTTCAPPAGGPWFGPMPIGVQHAEICYVVRRRPIIVTWA